MGAVEMTEPHSPTPAAPGATPGAGERSALLALKTLQLVTILGIAALLLASAILLLYGVVETMLYILRLVVPGPEPLTNRDMFLSSIKLIDLILLATIMQVVGIGLYSLFISRNLPVPDWLRTTHIDELKLKLAGIVAIMLGVLFLEQVFYWGSERDLIPLGIGIGVVILALSYFIKSHPEK
jgi:uncharacterized membrane protein YqhA